MANTAPTPQRVDDAVAFYEEQLGKTLTPQERLDVSEQTRKRAAVIAPAALMALVASVFKALEDAEKAGVPLATLMTGLPGTVRGAWLGTATKEATRTAAIAKTFVFGALTDGRTQGYKVYTQPKGGKPTVPVTYLKFDAVGDDRTTEVCAACDGTVLPASHPWWSSHSIPLHFGCRSIVIELTEREAKAIGVTASPPSVKVPEGFGHAGHVWAPKPEDYPKEIWAEYERQVAAESGKKGVQ